MTNSQKTRASRNAATWLVAGTCVLLLIASTTFAQDRPTVGAIRWDAWQDGGNVTAQMETTLAPSEYHHRLPWFADVTGPNSVSIDGNHQAIMDQEIAYAADAGLDYWAFVTYPLQYGMSNGFELYMNSSQKSRINFSHIVEGGRYVSGFDDIEGRLLTSFADSSYQRVLGNRPLLYIFNGQALADNGYTFDDLRADSIAQGSGDPYIVIQGWNPTTDKGYMQAVNADAIGRYAAPGGSYPTGTPFASSAAQDVNLWNQAAASGADVVPLVSAGWDRRPRYDAGGVTWESGPGNPNFYQEATPQELADHVDSALDWVRANPTAAPPDSVLVYAWNEHDEGGWISPTRNLDGTPDTSRLDAIAAVLNSIPVSVGNGSFETVGAVINTNWQQLPSPGAWVDGSPSAIYEILDLSVDATHFPTLNTAPDGVRVLNLANAAPLTQDLGYAIAAGDEITLAFHLGNSANQADPPGDITAYFTLDGADAFSQVVDNTAADGQFEHYSVIWTATSAGNLGLKFTGSNLWIDAVSVSVTPVPTPSALMMGLLGLAVVSPRRRAATPVRRSARLPQSSRNTQNMNSDIVY